MRATYLDQVDLGERFIIAWLLDIKNRNNVLVVKVSQKLHLTESSQAEHRVVKRRDFLDGDLLS